MKKIQVDFCGWGQRWPLAMLADNGTELLFEYTPEAIARDVELSRPNLKLRVPAYGGFPAHQFRLPGLIADALPDGWGLLLMDRLFRTLEVAAHQVSPIDRLAFIGERAMGALVFVPPSDITLAPADLSLLTLAKNVRHTIEASDIAALRQLLQVGGSPHGARPKALVQYDPERSAISTLEEASGTPWLIKFAAMHEHKEVCAIEHLYAGLAHQCGLDMPPTRYFDLDKKLAAFGIERFDRSNGMRVPVHSMAGALNADFRVPSTSYQTLLRLTRAMTSSEAEVRKAFERCLFNVIFHNRDDHAKNFSFRMDATLAWKLAPAYDLTFCEGPGGEHQMDIEGEGRVPGRLHLLKLAANTGLGKAWASESIDRFSDVALRFGVQAKDYAIRPVTRLHMARMIDANRCRMV